MMCYPVDLRDHVFLKDCRSLFFAKNIGKILTVKV